MNRLAWLDDARCAQVGGDEWHPESGGTTKWSKRICARCPVAAECLQYALDEGIAEGVWGGASAKERQRMRVERQAVAA